ncbi:DNA-binding protein [Plantactinospora sp. S1510]|uniref:DNA-binding protein n=1 Tax=Plantactinospora alkalitolerans TaxID=2789879 RepID=A0ABS0H6M8_9ACTN|nr:DNA-binding protein [Plantactinospora alkalitolerans]MBF9134125.1 DNA-binding protein [Plantactinospora alkalitolerans]
MAEPVEVNGVPAEAEFPTGLSSPARRALAAAGYRRLEQLDGVSEADLLRLHGMGPKAMGQLRAAMALHGLSFAGA